jgi:hypothetical protein
MTRTLIIVENAMNPSGERAEVEDQALDFVMGSRFQDLADFNFYLLKGFN